MTNQQHTPPPPSPPVAVITGASRGLGEALAVALVDHGWRLVIDARGPDDLDAVARQLSASGHVIARAGDVSDPHHRRELADAVAGLGRLDLLVNNASVLGASPLPALVDHSLAGLEHVYAVNTLAPLALIQLLLGPLSARGGTLINVSSDAAVEPYPGWGGYGSSKAALDQLTSVLAVEHPDLHVYSVDPGDMATDLHQQAFPDEDISDRPHPATVVPALLRLVGGDLPSGRYRAVDVEAALAPSGGGQR